MAPVAPQDQRPRNFRYIETEGSSAYRALWEAAIESGADWVQLITWNDYSENSQMAPSTRTQTGFYDLTAYYVTWFKTGAPPLIERDALYYFHRPHAMSATPAKQETLFTPMEGPTAIDEIELVALLRASGTLEIEVGGEITRVDVGAGMQSIRAPLREGTPVFRLRRGESTVVELHSATPISNAIDYQDPLFHAGAAPTCPVP
ncbi:MAG: glycoside hydrolase family 71 protein [Proteobacteria bacterium]|nr:glycoside hydrolase family 71 protein [Pseudomonadota bacterium]